MSSGPGSSRRRPILWSVASIVLFAALYATVVGLYAGSGDVVASTGQENSVWSLFEDMSMISVALYNSCIAGGTSTATCHANWATSAKIRTSPQQHW